MSNIIRRAALITAILAIPASAFAQTNQGLTRAEVRADLVQVEQAGYMPGDGDATNYPADIQAAETRIAMQSVAQKTDHSRSFGGVPMHGTSAPGRIQANAQNTCVGPVGFCTPYFGS